MLRSCADRFGHVCIQQTARTTSRIRLASQASFYHANLPNNDGQRSRDALAQRAYDKSHGDKKRVVDAFVLAKQAQAMLEKDLEDNVKRLIDRNVSMNLTVVWNHLITWRLKKSGITAALRDYNDMKKRGHFPNEHTYTILFNAMRDNPIPTILPKFKNLVSALLLDKRVTLSVIHLNVILRMCSNLRDLPLAYDMIRRFDEAGFDKLDAITYMTLFRLLELTIQDMPRGPQHSDFRLKPWKRKLSRELQEELDNASAIWQDLVDSWRKGVVKVDSRCVIAFARTMLQGEQKHYKQGVAAIVETFDITPYRPTNGQGPPIVGETSLRYGNFLEMNPAAAQTLTELVEGLEDAKQTAYYWQYCRTESQVKFGPVEYGARLRSLAAERNAPEARRVLQEMRENNVRITALAVRFVIQAHFSGRRDVLENLNILMKELLESDKKDEYFTFVNITTYTSAALRSQSLEAIVETIELVSTFDWKLLTERALPREREVLAILIPKLVSKLRTIAKEAASVKKTVMLDRFNDTMKSLAKEYFPQLQLDSQRSNDHHWRRRRPDDTRPYKLKQDVNTPIELEHGDMTEPIRASG